MVAESTLCKFDIIPLNQFITSSEASVQQLLLEVNRMAGGIQP